MSKDKMGKRPPDNQGLYCAICGKVWIAQGKDTIGEEIERGKLPAICDRCRDEWMKKRRKNEPKKD